MKAFVPGIYARSEALVQATRDLDRGRTTPEAVEALVQADTEEFLRVQQAAGIDLVSDGMLRWPDVFRPFVEAADGLEPGALTRFLDTNTFYRAPVATGGEPRLEAPLDERYSPLPDGDHLMTLPSPYAFAHGTGLTPEAVASGVLKPHLEALGDVQLVVLTEPFLAKEEKPDVGALAAALACLGGGPPLALWLTFADAGRLLPQLAELPVDGIGVDFYLTRLDAVPEGFSKLLLAGVCDVRGSLVEDPREVADFAARLAERAERVALTPNGDLQHVSQPIAAAKLARLGQARSALEGVAA